MTWRVRDPREVVGGCDSAVDGDCVMAYALLMADTQWGSGGATNYAAAYRRLIAGIRQSTVGPRSHLPLLGDWVEPNGGGSQFNWWTPRTSDFIPGHFRAFGRSRLAGPNEAAYWDKVVAVCQRSVERLHQRYASNTGLLPDFAQPTPASKRSLRPARPGILESPHDGEFYDNAGRNPWRLGTDALLNGDATSATQVRRLSRWARGNTQCRVRDLHAGYRLDGTTWSSTNYFSTFFAAPFAVAALLDKGAQRWLDAIYDAVVHEIARV